VLPSNSVTAVEGQEQTGTLGYSTRGKDKMLRCLRGVEWDSVITSLRDKTRQETRTGKLEAY
jgi:hypothetical protein